METRRQPDISGRKRNGSRTGRRLGNGPETERGGNGSGRYETETERNWNPTGRDGNGTKGNGTRGGACKKD